MGFNRECAMDWHRDIPAIRSLRAPIISAEAVREKNWAGGQQAGAEPARGR